MAERLRGGSGREGAVVDVLSHDDDEAHAAGRREVEVGARWR